jgi:hypothetical protein
VALEEFSLLQVLLTVSGAAEGECVAGENLRAALDRDSRAEIEPEKVEEVEVDSSSVVVAMDSLVAVRRMD